MLDGLLGRGFSSKCKSSIKLIKARIDVIRKKRNAMQKFLKKDIADLLANGLEVNAYGRAEGLLVELILSSCYDSVEQFCGIIPRHLSVMQKQRECPEECREAMSSLMFAAARFADLPELRDLRHIFTERYGNSLESFVNQEFVERIALGPPTTDKKLQLLREIAQEFSIKWDSKAFEQKLTKSPAFPQDQPKRHGSIHYPNNDGYRQHNIRDDTALNRGTQDVLSRGRWGLTDDEYKVHNKEENVRKRYNQDMPSGGRQELSDDGYKQHNGKEETVWKRDTQFVSSGGKRGLSDDGYEAHNGREEPVWKRDNQDNSSHGRRVVIDDGHIPFSGKEETKRDNQHLLFRGRRELVDDVLKRDDGLYDSSHGRRKHVDDGYHQAYNGGEDNAAHKRDYSNISSHGGHEYAEHHATKQKPNRADLTEKFTEEARSMKPQYKNVIPPPYVKPNGGKSDRNKAPTDPLALNGDILNDRSERTQTRSYCVDHERKMVGPASVNGHGDHQDDLAGCSKPKPRSTRRRHKKIPPGHDYTGSTEGGDEIVKRNLIGRKREDGRRGLQQVLDDDRDVRDEEERVMDRLLMHYSKKPLNLEPVRVARAKQDASPSYKDIDGGESRRRRSKVPPPTRTISLPSEPVTPTEVGRRPARATSFKPEMLNPAGHVHPKLPNYDDLAVQIASMKLKI